MGQRSSSEALLRLLDREATAPFQPSDGVRKAVRDLLREGGFKPSGRSKPASEYLAGVDSLGGINPVVDACNAASLHSGLPISVVDLDRHAGTRRTLSVVWGTTALPGHSAATLAWYRSLVAEFGVT